MAGWFSSKKPAESEEQLSGQARNDQLPGITGDQEKKSPIIITEAAREKIVELIGNAESPVLGIRVLAEATSPVNPEYSLAFVQEGEDFDDDTVLDFHEFKVFVDADSLSYVEEVQLDFVTSGMGGGFRIDKPRPKPVLEGPVAEKVQKIIDEQINPALGMHGGHVALISVKDGTAYIELGGGCRGCGMVDVTLKQGIEVMIKQNVPEINQILDTTDHASGKNPYYQPAK